LDVFFTFAGSSVSSFFFFRTGSLSIHSMRKTNGVLAMPAPGNKYVTPLRFELGGRPVLSAHLNVETAGSERKRPEIWTSACLETVFAIF
jgi:hypothetical protein